MDIENHFWDPPTVSTFGLILHFLGAAKLDPFEKAGWLYPISMLRIQHDLTTSGTPQNPESRSKKLTTEIDYQIKILVSPNLFPYF